MKPHNNSIWTVKFHYNEIWYTEHNFIITKYDPVKLKYDQVVGDREILLYIQILLYQSSKLLVSEFRVGTIALHYAKDDMGHYYTIAKLLVADLSQKMGFF